MRQADASDVSESIPVITSPGAPPCSRVKCRTPTAPPRMTRSQGAPLQPELREPTAHRKRLEQCEEFRDSRSGSRPSSELWIQQRTVTDDSDSYSVRSSSLDGL
eukprot:5146601-Pyramimonas_sp.AAC.1